ncbi:MAG: molybdopterin-dependent oxidoreductase [Steroidobacteraceae bacterium]
MVETTAICRFCHATCGLMVTIEQGRVVDIIGDIDNPVYHGYSCVKGRNYHEFHYDPARVLHPLRRDATGSLQPVSFDAALTAIAADLQRILAQHGPRSVAMYGGTFSHFCSAGVMLRDAFMDAIGSPMRFSNATIDQPGKPISMALHGRWGAGPQAFADADVCLLVGANPLVSMWGGIPTFNPAKRLHEARAGGLKLIVIDPRVTETARKADIHLQCLPGHDVELLAAMLNVIFAEALQDSSFVAAETQGFEALRVAVAPFTPERVAPLAGVPATQIAAAARTFAKARRGNATSGTGPSMAPYGVLMDYLVLALNTVCGRWVRAGEPLPNRGVLFRQFSGIARAEKPRPGVGLGQTLRIRSLTETAAGLPTSALADEILTPGAGQVRALLVVGGNPLLSWPNQAKTRRALESLELLVVVDPQVSATGRLAHYVLGPRFGLEEPAMSFGNEGITTYGLSIGYQEPYAQYQPRLIEPPDGSEVLADWRIFYELARRMGLKLAYRGQPIDMEDAPTTEALMEHFVRRSRVPLDLIKQHPHGHLYPDPQPLAEPKDADWPHRLQLADATMLGQLQQVSARLTSPAAAARAGASLPAAGPAVDGAVELLLVSRREHAVYNSVAHHLPALRRRRPFNPAYVNPADARRLGLEDGGAIEIESSAGRVNAVLQFAPDVREGVVSMAHGFDPLAGAGQGASTAALVDDENDYEPLSGLPRMSAIPVRLRRRAAI